MLSSDAMYSPVMSFSLSRSLFSLKAAALFFLAR
jgi:hypothetical protein